MNAIISGHSDDAVLKDQEINGGLRNFFLCVNLFNRTYSLGLTFSCLAQLLRILW